MKTKTRLEEFEELVAELLKFRPGCSISRSPDGKELRILAPTFSGTMTKITVDLARLGETPEQYLLKEIADEKSRPCPKCGKKITGFRDIESAMHRGAGCQECQDKEAKEVAGALHRVEFSEEAETKMDKFKDDISQRLLGRNRSECLAGKSCVGCGGPVVWFRDEVSWSEYRISGFCQKCQDEVFGK